MMRRRLLLAATLLALPGAAHAQAASGAHAFSFPGLMGGELRLAAYRGKALLVVNTATECGYTPQFEGLQRLYERRRTAGLVVLGVPSNDFGGQEPREGEAIAEFCALNYGVEFPMAARSVVTGEAAHPFYRWARSPEAFGAMGVPRWNFHKLVIDTRGRAVEAFGSDVRPEDRKLLGALDRAAKA